MRYVYTIMFEKGMSKIVNGTRYVLDDCNNLIILSEDVTAFIAQKWLCVDIKPSDISRQTN